ncbi:DUF3006 domain-containing protein [Planococcus faecalis]|uniref:DUF3006 domain-containing protein n=1 Tax=Planococcus faecalis TaxID=1598147 RepID=A0ABM6ING7_9BACL|nr:DUF3006 domain-containing protein [Planococcus faecalis]AQU78104.1 hypothetical protein AJGP001_01755 [Planococcus faecalis]OHX53712.1 hypothetical protein BB777_08190 [Planococcus faecalis]
MKGILDRIEDGRYAVILVEAEKLELILPFDYLPAGSHINSWFTIDAENRQLSIILDEETSLIKNQQTKELMDRLRMRKKGSRFKRK